jgi:hypothetical protein
MIIENVWIKFRGITDITLPNTTNKLKFEKPKRRERIVSRSFSPPQFLPTEIHKLASP